MQSADVEDDLKEYAFIMGVDIDKESYLLNILEEGINAPLPSGWIAQETEQQTIFISPEGN